MIGALIHKIDFGVTEERLSNLVSIFLNYFILRSQNACIDIFKFRCIIFHVN